LLSLTDSMQIILKRKCSLFLLAAVLVVLPVLGQDNETTKPPAADAAGFKQFSQNVQRYMNLHKRAQNGLPKLKDTTSPGAIADHERLLAQKIRAERPDARPGTIFQGSASTAFRHAIQREFSGSESKNARATIQQGAPVTNVHLEVNQLYPEDLPSTSVPPTLLLKFPKLPDELAYRIVDKDLVLLDVKANLVVDVMPRALP
jgi:hypothetical protein